jgi:hypothetical protein
MARGSVDQAGAAVRANSAHDSDISGRSGGLDEPNSDVHLFNGETLPDNSNNKQHAAHASFETSASSARQSLSGSGSMQPSSKRRVSASSRSLHTSRDGHGDERLFAPAAKSEEALGRTQPPDEQNGASKSASSDGFEDVEM